MPWRFACLSIDGVTGTLQSSGAAAELQIGGLDPKWKRAAGVLLGLVCPHSLLCLSHPEWEFCVREKKKNKLFWEVLFGLSSVLCSSRHTGDAVLFGTFPYPNFLSASIISSSLNCQLTSAGLSTSALEVTWYTT